MPDRRLVLVIILAGIAALYVADVLLARYWRYVPQNTWVSAALVFAMLAYIVAMILSGGRGLRLPSLPKRRRLRVVKRDPSSAAADFIKQFEDRSRR